jgi:Putative Tad-like Flp pilus-assembly
MPYRKPWIKSQGGQAIVLIAFMMIALMAGVGLAVDAGVGYYYNTSAERAAAAAALAGVIFMPSQYGGTQANAPDTSIPAGAGYDASDRAINEARRNGFDISDAGHNVRVIPAPVPGFTNKLQVTVSRTAPTFFMAMFGVPSFKVQRVAIATYLPPLTLGQPGSQIGGTVADMGNVARGGYYFMRNEGWSVSRDQGDAFTPNPASYGGSTDVHAISAVKNVDTADLSLPSRGGYNYLINLPAGGSIQVYNAINGPDNAGTKNHCNNSQVAGAVGPCSIGTSYYYHEEDGINFSDKTTFNAEEFTLFKVNSYFIRASDAKLSQFKVLPIDATNWNASPPTYKNVTTGATITQTYDGAGNPTNMATYHNWINVSTYNGGGDGGTMVHLSGLQPSGYTLPAGQYRLRMDSLNYDGTLPSPDGASGPGQSHKGYAVRVLDAAGNPCAACSLGAWDDMCIYTPISVPAGGSFTIPEFSVPPDYAGQTVTIDIYDPGDISGGGNVDLYILDPSGAVARPIAPATVAVYDLGTSRATSPGTLVTAPLADPTQAFVEATTGGGTHFNGHWVHFEVPIPTTYNPGTNPNNWYWSLKYVITSGVTATDTVTIAIGLKGNPAHLLIS